MKIMHRLLLASAVIALAGNSAFATTGEKASAYRLSDIQPAATLSMQKSKSLQYSAPLLPNKELATVVDIGDWVESDDTALLKSFEQKVSPVRRIGVGRDVWDTVDVDRTEQLLQWTDREDGSKVGVISFRSGNAFALRLGMRVQNLPDQALVHVAGPYTEGPVATLTGAAINEAIRANIQADGNTTEANTYWLPVVADQEVTLIIELPAEVANNRVQVAVPRISHIYDWPYNLEPEFNPEGLLPNPSDEPGLNTSGDCNNNSTCVKEVDTIRNSVARMIFTMPDGTPNLCTGTLLADQGRTGTPYFLTAAHCIDTQTVASTVETDWLFHAETCAAPNLLNRQAFRLVGGAQLRYSEIRFDTTLLELNRRPTHPQVVYAGWWANKELNQSVWGLHHPSGDALKVSYGKIGSYGTCEAPGHAGTFSCRPSLGDHSDYFNVTYSYGTVEGGSSGSGLFARHQDGEMYLIGVLKGGNSSCSVRNGDNYYGRFDRAFDDGLKYFLGPRTSNHADLRPVYRFYNTNSASHFYTQSAEERDHIIQVAPSMMYEGGQFLAYTYAAPQTSPVFRFYNHATGAHFYTISQGERDHVIATAPSTMEYEGIGWHARQNAGDGSASLYRYYNTENGTHFYTIHLQEKKIVDAIYPWMNYEGVGYYAWPITTQ